MPSVTPPLRDPPLSALPSPGVALTTYFLAFLLQISSPTSEPLPSESWMSTTSCAEWQASPLCPTMGPGPGWCACWRTRPARPRAPHPAPLHWSLSWWYCWWCWPSCVRRVPNTQHSGWINQLLDSCKAIQLLIYSWMIPYTKVPTSLELFLFFLEVRKVLAFHLFNYRLFSFFFLCTQMNCLNRASRCSDQTPGGCSMESWPLCFAQSRPWSEVCLHLAAVLHSSFHQGKKEAHVKVVAAVYFWPSSCGFFTLYKVPERTYLSLAHPSVKLTKNCRIQRTKWKIWVPSQSLGAQNFLPALRSRRIYHR